MKTFVLRTSLWTEMRQRLQASSDETCAVLLTRPGASTASMVVRSEIPVPDDAYRRRSPIDAELTPEFLFMVTERARAERSGLLFIHTHPRTVGRPHFSTRDDEGEMGLKSYLDVKLPGRPHGTMIVAPDGCRARLLCGDEIAVKEIGASVRYLCEPGDVSESDHAQIFDRQVRAFGAAGQRLIGRVKVGLIGVGGTGSVCSQQLAYLGVRRFVLIDAKLLDATNLNRVVSAGQGDAGAAKVELTRRMIHRIDQDADVETVVGSALDPECLRRLADCDFVFLCTDNHASRLEASRFCYRNYMPAIDIGVAIGVEAGRVATISGRVQMIAPGLPCLLCTSSISPDAVRRETMPAGHQAADPYFGSGGEPQPAVISINSTVSSLAVSMFASAITGLPIESRHVRYDGLKSKAYPLAANAHPTCLVCSAVGELGQGEAVCDDQTGARAAPHLTR